MSDMEIIEKAIKRINIDNSGDVNPNDIEKIEDAVMRMNNTIINLQTHTAKSEAHYKTVEDKMLSLIEEIGSEKSKLITENEALRLKEKGYIHDMNLALQANERLAADLTLARIQIEAYQCKEAYFNQSVQDHICHSCANDECANSYPGDGSDLDFCEYWKQK